MYNHDIYIHIIIIIIIIILPTVIIMMVLRLYINDVGCIYLKSWSDVFSKMIIAA